MVNITQATNAYLSVAKMPGEKDETMEASGSASSSGGLAPSFGELLKTSLDTAISSGYNSEKLSTLAVGGKAQLHEMVTAVSNAELALNTIVAMRDKVITAYQDILRMTI